MATAAMGTRYSPSSPPGPSPDTTSPLYPDRPIRPLPKRRLRSRLSSDLAESIDYPPTPAPSAPLFYLPYSLGGATGANGRPHDPSCEHNLGYGQQPDEPESEDEEVLARANRQFNGPPSGYATILSDLQIRAHNQLNVGSAGPNAPIVFPKPAAPNSSASSVDGYDSFENTNNKKKRKIPTSGVASSHHSHLSTELANMGISSSASDAPPSPQDDIVGAAGHYYGSGYPSGMAIPAAASSGTGVSGAGRGRFGRPAGRDVNTRSPLGVSANGSNAWASGRGGRYRSGAWNQSSGSKTGSQPTLTSQSTNAGSAYPADHGIISAAIASAAENGIRPPAKGQENVSLLQQQAIKKPSPTKTQFTFTSGSEVTWPGGKSGESRTQGSVRNMSTQGTQTSPNLVGTGKPSQPSQQANRAAQANAQQASAEQQAAEYPKKPRRRPGKEYALAARNRRLHQEDKNFHHPPSREEIWICEFCEYESIFGTPPEALMRQYEIKDRQERRKILEKRRLLEKAKSKGRKGKKSKAAAKAVPPTTSTASSHAPPPQQTQAPLQKQTYSQGTQADNLPKDDFVYDDLPLDEYDGPLPLDLPNTIKALDVPKKVAPVPASAAGVNDALKAAVGRAKRGA